MVCSSLEVERASPRVMRDVLGTGGEKQEWGGCLENFLVEGRAGFWHWERRGCPLGSGPSWANTERWDVMGH
jgi:hypothetical protein